MDPQPSHVPVKSDATHGSVSSSSSTGERSVPAEGAATNTDEKDSKLVERVQDITLESRSKTEWTTSTASIHLTTNVSSKTGMFEEEEEGELDYEEDEGEIAGVQEDKNGMKNDTDGDKEEGELEEDEQDEEGEEGEILSDEDEKVMLECHNAAYKNTIPSLICYLMFVAVSSTMLANDNSAASQSCILIGQIIATEAIRKLSKRCQNVVKHS